MKTLGIVINTSWNIYNFRLGLLQALQKEGYHIVVIAPYDDYAKKIEALGFEYHNIIINNKGTNPIEDLKLIWAFYRLYSRLNLDVLLHYTIKPNIYGTIAAKLAGTPVISNISGLGTVFLNNRVSSKVARFLYKFALLFPVKVFFQNQDDKDLFVNSNLVAKAKTSLLPGSGINTKTFSPIVSEHLNQSLSFLFIARLVKDKGLREYVEAAKLLKIKYPKVQFAVLGAFYYGNPTAILPQEIAAWEKEGLIEYLGARDNVAPVIASVDCVVLPSYREGLSRVLLEAASMAKPIVTTNVPGCRDVVEDGINGFLCKLKDVKDLAKQIEKMINLDEVERVEMGRKGRDKVVEEFDETIVINQYKETIKSVLTYRNPPIMDLIES